MILDKRNFYEVKKEYLILQVNRNLTDVLWDIILPVQNKYIVPTPSKGQDSTVLQPIPEHSILVIIRKSETKIDLASYLHAACFSAVHSNFTKFISNNQLTTRPGLTSKLLIKHLSASIDTTKGYINQECQNLQ